MEERFIEEDEVVTIWTMSELGLIGCPSHLCVAVTLAYVKGFFLQLFHHIPVRVFSKYFIFIETKLYT